MRWHQLLTGCMLSLTVFAGCGWTGRTPVMSPPSVTEVSNKEDIHPEAETASNKPRARSLLTSVSPAVKPRQSLDEMVLFQPVKIPKARTQTAPVPFEDVELTAGDGTRLRAWWVGHPQPSAVVLYLHGNGGNLWYLQDVLRWLNDTAHCAVMAVDYRGFGDSDGTPTVDGVLQDVRAARTEAAKRGGIAESEIVLMGRSLGGALAIQSAKELSPRGLIIESTFTTLEEVGRVHMGSLAALVPDGRLDSLTALADYSGPLLHSHGDADRVIPFTQGLRLFSVAAEPKQFVRIDGGDHNDPPTSEYLATLLEFLRDLP